MTTKKLVKTAVLLLSLAALSACPGKSQERINAAPPPPPPPPQALTNPGNNIGGNNPGAGQVDTIFKTIQCEFEGNRVKSRKYFSSSINIPRTVSLILLDGRYETSIDLRTKFLGLDIGKFGKISMQFVPAVKTKSGTDTIILIDDGINKNLRMSQSGFAGQMTKLEAHDDGMYVTVSCKGTSQFKSAAPSTSKTNLVCRGKSSTAVTAEEQVDISIPLNSIVAGEEFTISEAVSAKLDTDSTAITYSGSLDPDYGPVVTSTASLKSAATFRLIDTSKEAQSSLEINITCHIQ